MLSLNNESATVVMLEITGIFQAIKNAFKATK